jgi:MYXO-CTERM domain-containing protein
LAAEAINTTGADTSQGPVLLLLLLLLLLLQEHAV